MYHWNKRKMVKEVYQLKKKWNHWDGEFIKFLDLEILIWRLNWKLWLHIPEGRVRVTNKSRLNCPLRWLTSYISYVLRWPQEGQIIPKNSNLTLQLQHRSQIQDCFLNCDHRIVQVGKGHEVSAPASCSKQVQHWIQSGLFRGLSSWVLKSSKEGDSTAFLGPHSKAWLSSQQKKNSWLEPPLSLSVVSCFFAIHLSKKHWSC